LEVDHLKGPTDTMNKLTAAQKKAISDRIAELDPNRKVVTLTPNAGFTGGSIAFNKESGITFHENITRLTDEEYVRSYIVVRLVTELRYPADCLELEKGYTIGRPTGKSAQLDIRILDKRDKKKPKTFMLIEAKRPDDYESYTSLMEDQLFSPGNQEHAAGVNYVVWYTLEFHNETTYRDKCIIVDFKKFTEHQAWVLAGEPGHNLDLPAEYGTVRKQKYIKGSDTDLRTDVTREEMTKLQKDFHNQLWGGAKMGDADVFNNLLKMFFAKIYDERNTAEEEAYKFQTELKDGSPEPAEEILTKVNSIYQDALRHYFKYSEETVQLNTINKEKFKPAKVAYVMERLEGISIIENKFEDDVLGVFFEAIVRTGFKQEKGQFFTHSNIVRFILYALGLDEWAIESINGASPRLLYIMDPACGSGTFLIEAVKLITYSVLHANNAKLKKTGNVKDYVQEWFQPNSENKNIHNRWAREFVYGIDDNDDLVMATKVNMILHGDGNANIEKADGLADFEKYHRNRTQVKKVDANHPYKLPRNEQFDCIISNPPFSLKEDPRTLASYATRFAYAEKKNSENLFIERWYQSLKEGGRMGVVLPDSVFDTNENLYIRTFLYRFFYIKAAVSLPQVSFQPYTPTKTSLLFALKKTKREVEKWDAAWRKAANEYGKLRQTEIIRFVLTNDRIRNGLIDIANRAEVEWYPATNMFSAATLPHAVRDQLAESTKESTGLKKRLAGVLADLETFLGEPSLASWKNGEKKEALTTITHLLRHKLTPAVAGLPLPELVEAAYDEIVEASELNFTEDHKGKPYCNSWWCFAEVASQKEFDCPIFFAEAEHVGYKRTTRHPEGIEQPNDLLRTDEHGNVLIDRDNPQKILDYLRAEGFFFWKPESLDNAAKIRSYHAHMSDCSESFGLRFSARYLHPRFRFLSERVLGVISTIPLGKLVLRSIDTGVQPDYSKTGVKVVKIRTMKNGYFDWSEAQYVDDEFYADNFRRAGLRKGDIVVSSTGVGSLGKVDLWETDERALVTVDVNIVRIVEGRADPAFLVHLLRHRLVQWQVEQELAGATNQIHIYGDQLARLRLPHFSKDAYARLAKKIAEAAKELSDTRTILRLPGDIINEAMCAEFGYPLKEHQERSRLHQFSASFSKMAAGFTLRNSSRYHHPDFDLTEAFFARQKHETVKAFVATPIRLGSTAENGDFVEAGDAYYVHPGATKRQEAISLEDSHQVSDEFYKDRSRRCGLQRLDVTINRSGEAVGKVAYYDSDAPALFSDFTMRLRFNARMNPLFAWLYFRSVMFQAQLFREIKGASLPNIFPGQVERLLVVSCGRSRQDDLVKSIMADLRKQADAKQKIHDKINEIQVAIESEVLAEHKRYDGQRGVNHEGKDNSQE
jgi:type I restriction enzyme M protein